MKYQIKVEITRGVYWQYYVKEYTTIDEAAQFLEFLMPEYEHKGTDHDITTLIQGKCRVFCNFDIENVEEPTRNIIHRLDDAPIRMPMSRETISIVKSRLVSIEELACEALNRATYLDTKRLRRELRKKLGDTHETRHSWKFDRTSQSELCEQVKSIVRALEDKPRRNRRKKKPTPSARRNVVQKTSRNRTRGL